MTTPAINQEEFLRDSLLVQQQRLDVNPPVVKTATVQRYHAGTLRRRPASSPSPVREDGSRAPKPWSHLWFVYRAFYRRYVVTTGVQFNRHYRLEYLGGCPTGVVYPAVTLKMYQDQVCEQARFRWCDGGALREFPPSIIAEATTRVRLAALEGAATLGTSLVELHKTAGYVTDLARRTERTIRYLTSASPKQLLSDWKNMSVKARREAKRKRVLETLRRGRVDRRLHRETRAAYQRRLAAERWVLDKWLEYQFAVKPLVLDLTSAAEALSYWHFERGLPLRCTFKKGASREWRAQYAVTTSHSGPDVFSRGSVIERIPLLVQGSAHYSLVYDIPVGTDRDLQQLGLTSPAADMWEAVKFSWLTDYVVGIGDWLRAMTRMDHMDFVEGSLSLTGKIISDGGLVFLNPDPSNTNTVSVKGEGRCLLNAGRFERRMVDKTPAPAGFPALKKHIGLNQMANALSALAKAAGSSGNLRI